jgi:hypothetical protein
MSPVSRGRKPKRIVHHPSKSAPASPFAPILADAEQLVAQSDPLVAELWASDLLGSLFDAAWREAVSAGVPADPETEPTDPDELFELELTALLEYLSAQRKPGALAALRALGSVGEDWTRDMALDATEPLSERGVKEPAWLANAHEPTFDGLFAAADEFGDREAISLAYTRGTETHVLTAHLVQAVDRELVALTLHLGFNRDELAAEFADIHAMSPVELDPTEARARLDDALDLLLSSEPADLFDEDADHDGHDHDGHDHDHDHDHDEEITHGDPKLLWPLLAVRLELLPEEEDAEDDADPLAATTGNVIPDTAGLVRGAVEAFLASARAADLPDREFAGHLATVLADEAAAGERGVYGFGPFATALSLDGETVGHLALTSRQLDQFGPVLAAWAHFTADARGLPAAAHETWDARLAELTEQFLAVYLDPEAVDHREQCPDVIPIEKFEPGAMPSEQDLAADLARLLASATSLNQTDDVDLAEDEDEDEEED